MDRTKFTSYFRKTKQVSRIGTTLCLSAAFLLISTLSSGQDRDGLNRYKKENAALLQAAGQEQNRTVGKKGKANGHRPQRVVFMGNSITENWVKFRPEYFTDKGYIGRGISGQTTPQMLVQFRQDVVNIKADVVVILAGTNDIAGNTGPATPAMVLDNIASMCDIAKANRIRVILCSVLPARQYPWNKTARPDILIPHLNDLIREYARENGIPYVDFFSALTDGENGLPAQFSKDGVHPGVQGYEIMENLLEKYLK